ncbi:MAG: F0F1-type ATP synthase assembly protein I [Salibacteraceae bacterium]
MDSNKKEQPKKQPNTLMTLSGVGAQMGITIWLGAQLGKWLDEKYPSDKNWFTIGLVLFAVGISLYNLIQQVNRLNK